MAFRCLRDFQAGIHIYNDIKIPFRQFMPKNRKAADKYPSVLFLHGTGERGTDL